MEQQGAKTKTERRGVSNDSAWLGCNKRLIHFSDSKIDEPLRDVDAQESGRKPKGFWISVEGGDDGWKSWCEAEGFALDKFEVSYEIKLVEMPNIKIISNALDLDCFHEKYKEPISPEAVYVRDHINWNRVADEYKGIIIAPYIWERRLEGDASSWYYGWDCASGCIWDTSAIDSINLVAG